MSDEIISLSDLIAFLLELTFDEIFAACIRLF